LKILGVVLIALLIGGGLLWYFVFDSNESKEPKVTVKEEVPPFAKYIASYTDKGEVSLFHVEDQKEVDKTDLGLLSKSKVDKVVEEKAEQINSKPFIFFTDETGKALYAFHNVSKEVSKLTVSDDKWKVEQVATLDKARDSGWLFVDKERIWLADSKYNHIQVFSFSDLSTVQEWDTKGVMTKWHIKEDVIHYAYDNRMVAQQIGKKELKDVQLGDSTLDFVYLQDKFYMLNAFGEKSDNSLLLKVTAKDLVVEDLMELKSNETAILSHGESEKLFVGKVEKTMGLDGKITEEPKVISFELTSNYLREQDMNWKLPFSPNMKGYNSHLYVVDNESTLRIYQSGQENPVKEILVLSPTFSLLH